MENSSGIYSMYRQFYFINVFHRTIFHWASYIDFFIQRLNQMNNKKILQGSLVQFVRY